MCVLDFKNVYQAVGFKRERCWEVAICISYSVFIYPICFPSEVVNRSFLMRILSLCISSVSV